MAGPCAGGGRRTRPVLSLLLHVAFLPTLPPPILPSLLPSPSPTLPRPWLPPHATTGWNLAVSRDTKPRQAHSCWATRHSELSANEYTNNWSRYQSPVSVALSRYSWVLVLWGLTRFYWPARLRTSPWIGRFAEEVDAVLGDCWETTSILIPVRPTLATGHSLRWLHCMCVCVSVCVCTYTRAPSRALRKVHGGWDRETIPFPFPTCLSPVPRESLFVKIHILGLWLGVKNPEVKKSCNSHLSYNILGDSLANEVK